MVFRYVDDFLVLAISLTVVTEDLMKQVLDVFLSKARLTFTHEEMETGSLQFLDLNLKFETNHVCWKYEPRSKKNVLPFDSAHSKFVKRGAASSLMQAALEKSCVHAADPSFQNQIGRLKKVGFPARILVEIALPTAFSPR